MFRSFLADDKIRGIKQSLVQYNDDFSDYLYEFQPAVTPYVVSELRGNKVLRLFRFWTISDGNAANEQFKISIVNIKPDTKEFDIRVRAYYDTDAQPVILETFSRCSMDPTSNNYVARRVGTLDGNYVSEPMSYQEFAMMIEGRAQYMVKATHNKTGNVKVSTYVADKDESEYGVRSRAEREHKPMGYSINSVRRKDVEAHGEDEEDETVSTQKRGRGRPAGSKSGARGPRIK
jgi:hypothetical protein